MASVLPDSMPAICDPMGPQCCLNLPSGLLERLACPRCKSALRTTLASVSCSDQRCGREYPVIDGVPILIVDENSVFAVEDFVQGDSTTFDWDRLTSRSKGGIGTRLAHFIADRSPSLTLPVADFTVEEALAQICTQIPAARILI